MRAALFLFPLALFAADQLHARDNGQFADRPPEDRAWYNTRELTPETQKRLGVAWKSCCDHSDKVQTQFRVNSTSGGDEWFWLVPSTGEWRRVPPDTIHYGDPAPDNMPTLFVYQGIETCFFPPEAGV